ncbi:MAG: pyruvate:ferredoxin (flavodoxin) oxidoreductase [Clostridia bacterium]|nr:pyruvate:ferredoxin (flavodoxin) oxidoreductase [Clostridia bacterium]
MKRKAKTMDGNTAAAHVSYAFTEVAAIYPITPSSVMADETDKYSVSGRKNLFGKEVEVTEMQSEAGVAGAVHGSLAAGALTTTYTASQGLLLMIPNMYKMAGELLPSVIHVSARSIAGHALSIFGDHSDIYACRQTGYAMLCSNSPQEVMDLGAVAHLAAIKGRVPFLHFFDGFRTSHEIQKIEMWDYEDLKELLDFEAVDRFRRRALNPEHPVLRGTAQNDDIFFQAKEACNKYYEAIPKIVVDYMNKINSKIGTDYKPFNYYGAKDADRVIIAMGSVCEAIEEVVDYLNAKGEKVGLVKVRLYRPFVAKYLADILPKSVKSISVLDRTKEPGSIGEPLFLDVLAALSEAEISNVKIYGGRYGLSSKDTSPGDIIAVYKNMLSSHPKKRFTIGITDDVTHLSLEVTQSPDTTPKDTTSCKFWGLGADGTVGANKNSIKIIGDHTDMYAQGYFAYDSKKSGGLTVSHLRFGKHPIKSTYYITKADFVACHNPSYVTKYDMVEDLKEGGSFLLNCPWTAEELEERLPNKMKKYIAENNIKLYVIDGIKIGKEIGLGGRINTILQAAFFKIANIIPSDDAIRYMKDAATKSYSKKGEKIVAMNHAAIERGMTELKEIHIPDAWKNLKEIDHSDADSCSNCDDVGRYVNNIMKPINEYKGNKLPVSAFLKYADGTTPLGSSAFEKRGVAVDVPEWLPKNCIECNFCSLVCPHAVIRAIALKDEELDKAPEGMKYKELIGVDGKKFSVVISTLDCTGCEACVNVCPGKNGEKALCMRPIDTQKHQQKIFDYSVKLPEKCDVIKKFKETTVKGSQFKQPLLEFSGACAGCGETPYAKLATQLFGDRMYIANATGCSSIWGGSAPATPYTVNKEGKGPAWQNSLFEDNAEFGFGMALAQDAIRGRLKNYVEEIEKSTTDEDLELACHQYLVSFNESKRNAKAAENLIERLENLQIAQNALYSLAEKILRDKDYLAKKSVWIFGGDGWAYDIGFGGLDHVIASGKNVNILVFDTEVYSNTGGQASKATPMGSVAQFASGGKATRKKDLAAIAMSYGHVYVAQVAMGANYNQCVKAFSEAETYMGPSIIIAYSPCINHGIKGGLGHAQQEEKSAVESGYWNLFRFDPRLSESGKNPFTLDSKPPTSDYKDFIMNEIRYSALSRSFPEKAEALFSKAEQCAKEKYEHLENLSKSM